MQLFELGTDPSNVHEWDWEAGIREFIQGYLDNKNGGDWDHQDTTLTLRNYNTRLERKTLLAGYSSKRNDDSQRGKFGDGLTSGICVLLREGMDITMHNSDVIWKPVITYSDQFEHDVVAIEETLADTPDEDYTVVIEGITASDMERIVSYTLDLQDEYEHFYTSQGTILLEEQHKGRIYVGGLFVDHFDSSYGFDFPPECFELDRDRKSLKPFDIKWKLKDLISEMSRQDVDEELSDRIVSSMESGDGSMEYVHHEYASSRNKTFQESAEKLYKEKHDGNIITSSYEEAEKLREAGNKNVKLVRNEGFVKLVRQTESHQLVFGARKEKEEISIENLLDNFEEDWQHEMTDTDFYEAWQKLSEEIKERT